MRFLIKGIAVALTVPVKMLLDTCVAYWAINEVLDAMPTMVHFA